MLSFHWMETNALELHTISQETMHKLQLVVTDVQETFQ